MNMATLDFHSNDAAPSTQLYDARIQVLNGSNSTYGGGSMYIYAANTYFYTPVYVLDSDGIWCGSAVTGSQMTPTIATSLILNCNNYFRPEQPASYLLSRPARPLQKCPGLLLNAHQMPKEMLAASDFFPAL